VADPGPAEVLILGAGIAGCALAYHLTLRSVGPVVVYDPRTPAAGATGRAAGVLTEQLWNQWDVEVARETHREYAELCRRWEPDAYQQNGFVRCTANRAALPVLEESAERLRSWGVDVELAGREDLSRWLPAGQFDDVVGALYGRHDGCVTPSAMATIYAENARERGATFDFGQPMLGLEHRDVGWALRTPSGTRKCSEIVVAAGAWSKALLRGLGHPLPLTPYRTQAASLRVPGSLRAGFPTVHDIDLDVYVRPEGPSRLIAGDGTEKVEADPERFVPGGDAEFLTHLAESLAARFPGWADSQVVAAWAGVCTSTPDRRPLIGPVADAPGLYVMTGFNGFGVMRAGGAGRRLADLIAEGPDAEPAREALRPVWPSRFPDGFPCAPPKPGFTLEPGDHPRF
jgi:sarcosine oxidase subunit beta